ncbi:MAG: hypothetical protein U0360_00675 [Dehalococcoidia bacterium]
MIGTISARASDIVAWIALASTTNTTLLILTAASRLLFDMGRKGALPSFLGHANGTTSRRTRLWSWRW